MTFQATFSIRQRPSIHRMCYKPQYLVEYQRTRIYQCEQRKLASSYRTGIKTHQQLFLIIFSLSSNNLIVCYILQAKEAWDVVESFRSTDLPAFADMIKTIVPMIDGSKSLSNRITALEMQLLNGTAMASPNKGVRYYLHFAQLLYS